MSTSIDPATRAPTTERPGGAQYGPPPQPPIGTRGVVIGTVLLGLMLLAFGWWANEAGTRAGAEARAVPDILLVEPVDGEVVDGGAAVIFETGAELRRGPAGWETRGYHIHAAVDGMELMPGPDDISRLGDGRYRWLVRPLNPGTRELRLFWSDRNHREIAEGASRTVRIESR